MNKGIILITKHFPYNNGDTPAESYLENEIFALSRSAEKVFVIATEAQKGRKITAALPSNVKSAAIQTKKQKIVKATSFVKGLPLLVKKSNPELAEESKNLSLKRKLFLNYFYKRASQKLSAIEAEVNGGAFDPAEYDTIYSYWFFDYAYAAIKMREKYGMKNAACVSRAHGYDLYDYANSLNYIPLREYMLQNIDAVFTCSEDGKKYLSERFPKYSAKIKVSFLGCADRGIQSYSRMSGTVRIASCSSVIPLKRVDKILDCAEELCRRGYAVEWTHVGGGSLFSKLEERAKQTNGKIKVTLKGSIPNKQIMELYAASCFDVFINVSTREGIPISIMEAISFGIPVTATDVGGTHEIISSGKNGFLIDKDFETAQLADTVESLMKMDESKYLSLREGARNTFENKFEFIRNVNDFLSSIPR